MIRLLFPPGALAAGGAVDVPEAEVHHLRVRRLDTPACALGLDGEGGVASGTLRQVDAQGSPWRFDVATFERRPRPVPAELWVGTGDRERFGWLVEKCAEFGVTRLVPVETERARSVATRLRAKHLPSLRARARETIKQCGAAWAPDVSDVTPWEMVVAPPGEDGWSRWLADPQGEGPPAGGWERPLAVLVGPEGGFVPEERRAALEAGYRPIRLSPHILRFETAAVAAAALIAMHRRPDD